MKKVGKKLISFAAIGAGVAAIGWAVSAGAAFKNVMFRPKPESDGKYHGIEASADDVEWGKFTPVDSISATARDGVALHAFRYVNETPTHKWIIAQHGWKAKASQMLPFAHHFYEAGYNVLLPDLRAHGESGGKYVGWGFLDKYDVITWIHEILKEDPEAEIALFGHSLGAATVLMTLGEELPPNVKCAISDSAFTSAYDTMVASFAAKTPASAPHIASLLDRMCRAKAGYSMKKASAEEALKANSRPVLLFHGTDDRVLPCAMATRLYKASDGKAELMMIPEAKHKTCHDFSGYWPKADAFLKKNL